MVKNSNYQDLLKLAAISAMILDHLGVYFFPELLKLRVIGRYAMPIFAFFVGYNFKGVPNFSILIYGLILYFISIIFVYHNFVAANILISLFAGQFYLYLFQDHFKKLITGWVHFIILVSLYPFTFYFFDYGSLIIGIIVIAYMVRVKSINVKIAAFVITITSLLHIAASFSNFSNVDWFFSFVVGVFIYLSLAHNDFAKKIFLDVRIISRHSMLIYFIHVLIIQFTWRY